MLQVFGLALASFTVVHLSVPQAAEANRVSSQPTLRTLQEERLGALRRISEIIAEKYRAGNASFPELWAATEAAAEAELQLCATDKERVSVLQRLLEQARSLENQAAQLAHNKLLPAETALRAKADRLEAEIRLEQARASLSGGSK